MYNIAGSGSETSPFKWIRIRPITMEKLYLFNILLGTPDKIRPQMVENMYDAGAPTPGSIIDFLKIRTHGFIKVKGRIRIRIKVIWIRNTICRFYSPDPTF